MRSFTLLAVHAALAVVLVATVIGLVTLWPEGTPVAALPAGGAPERSAVVTRVELAPCRSPAAKGCVLVTARLTSGPDAGAETSLIFGEIRGDVRPDVGDRIRVVETGVAGGALGSEVDASRYAFVDFERTRPLVLLVVLFAGLVILLSRRQGVLSLVGLGASLALVVLFVVPAILEGASPVGVALVGALTVMFITIPLCHGLGAKAVAACLGTTVALSVTVLLAEAFTRAARLSGLTTDEASFVAASDNGVSMRGLVVAGMVIGALGVLDDLTVSQSSTVLALRSANPALGARELYRRALDVGRDHVAATVNTLVLAYVGAALPILLVFSLSGQSFSGAVGSEVVAAEIVAMLVGSIGLVLAVPITTALAALLAAKLDPAGLAAAEHAHHH